MPKGLWLDERRFVAFSEPRQRLTDQIATRGRSTDYYSLGMLLPNPDPVLKAQGQDLRIYRELRSDAHVGGCVRRRKAAVKALRHGVDREKAKSRVSKNIEAIFADLPLDRILGEILEAPLYGYQPLEITWRKAGGLVVPVDIESKPPEWFGYDAENRLRFKSRFAPVEGEALPARKFLVARQEPTYANPYGVPDLAMCFWPLVFKRGGVKFWLNFAEKYGTPWAVGKTPRGTPISEQDQLADNLEAMIQDAVAVIPDDASVEIIEAAGKSASADLYERLVMYARSEVSIALTGTNQTVEADTNRASAAAGLEVAENIRDGDVGIAVETLNQLIRWIVDLNWPGAERPVFSLWDQEALDKLQSERDRNVAASGGRFTNRYWERTYEYRPGDLAEAAPPGERPLPGAPGLPAQFAEAGHAPGYAEAAAGTLDEAAAPAWQAILDRVRALVDEAQSLTALRDALLDAFGGLPMDDLGHVMALAFEAAELAGVADVAEESRR